MLSSPSAPQKSKWICNQNLLNEEICFAKNRIFRQKKKLPTSKLFCDNFRVKAICRNFLKLVTSFFFGKNLQTNFLIQKFCTYSCIFLGQIRSNVTFLTFYGYIWSRSLKKWHLAFVKVISRSFLKYEIIWMLDRPDPAGM